MEFATRQKSRFVYASSSSVYGQQEAGPFSESMSCSQPESYYAATKKANELMAHAYSKTKGLSSIGLRFFTVYGPWGRPDMAPWLFVEAALNNKEIKVFNRGNQQRDFTFIDDIVSGIYEVTLNFAMDGQATILNIGNGHPQQLMRFIEVIEIITSVKLRKQFVDRQKGDVDSTFASIDEINRLTGFQPKTSLEDGMTEFVNWYKDYLKKR